MIDSSPPILLCNASYYGTLAAVRALGEAGVGILTADPSSICHSRYSRYTTEHLISPYFNDTTKLKDWLLRIGRSGPRKVLYATSDAVSFALALYHAELSAEFELYQPNIDAIMCILDKGRLIENAKAVGLETPDTWFPHSVDEAEKIASDVGGKLLIKPRLQISQYRATKATLAQDSAKEVRGHFEGYLNDSARGSALAKKYPDTLIPLLQRYHPESGLAVYSVSGFRENVQGRIVARGSRKILQHPRPIGIGLCFESAPVDPRLLEKISLLCNRIGYYGVFELEFINVDQKPLLIDFNGRYFHQMALDIARGMNLPAMSYAAAVGNRAEVDRLMTKADQEGSRGAAGFCHRLDLAATVTVQRYMRGISPEDAARWRHWAGGSGGKIVDAVRYPGDMLPWCVDIALRGWHAVRHPRGTIRHYAANMGQQVAS